MSIKNPIVGHVSRLEISSNRSQGVGHAAEPLRDLGAAWRDRGQTHLKQRVLLVVEDIELLRSIAVGLHHADLEWTATSNGDSALQIFRETAPDLVLVDARLPDESGLAPCQSIRRESQVPIVMLVAAGRSIQQVHCLRMGGR